MSLPQVARRYASALFEVAEEAGAVNEIQADMEALAKIFRELPEVLDWCRDSHAHFDSAETFVATAFLPYVGTLTARTLKLAAGHNRLEVIPLLPAAVQILSNRKSAVVPVVLEAIQEPDRDLVEQVAVFLGQRTGKTAAVSWRIRPELKGGIRILWDDSVIDLSAREKLRRLRALLISP
jgi:F-type H+-transporting ATPase subunit delta